MITLAKFFRRILQWVALYRQVLFLPNHNESIYRSIDHNFVYLGDFVFYGFGYDDANDDYKVVGVVNNVHDDNIGQYDDYANVVCMDMVWVYRLKSNSWRLVESTNSQGYFIDDITALIDNHVVHWKYQSLSQHWIRCFDLCNERWTDDVPMPETNQRVIDLGVLNGSLCLLTQIHKTFAAGIWVIKEYAVKESWVKLLCISNSSVACPLAYGKGSCSKEVLLGKFKEFSQSALIWYNIGDKTSRPVEIYGIRLYYEAYASKSSLVAIPGGEQLSRK